MDNWNLLALSWVLVGIFEIVQCFPVDANTLVTNQSKANGTNYEIMTTPPLTSDKTVWFGSWKKPNDKRKIELMKMKLEPRQEVEQTPKRKIPKGDIKVIDDICSDVTTEGGSRIYLRRIRKRYSNITAIGRLVFSGYLEVINSCCEFETGDNHCTEYEQYAILNKYKLSNSYILRPFGYSLAVVALVGVLFFIPTNQL